MANTVGYVSRTLDADIAEKNITLDTKEFLLIYNASANVVTINIDNATTEDGAIVLAAGQKIENFNQFCHNLYYKAAGDNSIVYVIGYKKDI